MTSLACWNDRNISTVRVLLTMVVATLASACSSDGKSNSGASSSASASAAAPSAATSAATTPDGKPPCLLEGDWTACAIEDRLTHAGVVFDRQAEPVSYPFFAVKGTVYHIGNPEHELQVFLYASAADRARDTKALDSAAVAPKGTRRAWRTPPTLVTSNNMAAVILSLNDRTVERLALALGAGLPQPEKR